MHQPKGRIALLSVSRVISFCIVGFLASMRPCFAQVPPQSQAKSSALGGNAKATTPGVLPLSYDQVVQRAKALVTARPQDAVQLCKQAIRQDPTRYEAHVIAAAALRQQKQYQQAVVHLQTAMALAPGDDASRIRLALTETKEASLPDEARRKLDVLRLIIQDADRSTQDERNKLLEEFLQKSEPFVEEYPSDVSIWVLRAAAALEGKRSAEGEEAAFQLLRLGLDKSENEGIRRLIAEMDRQGWIYEMTLDVEPQVAAFNKFLKAMGIVEGRDQLADGSASSSTRFSYSELGGKCSTGFDLASNQAVETRYNSSDPALAWTATDLLTGTFHLDIASSKFVAFALPNVPSGDLQGLFMVALQPRPTVLNKRRHTMTTRSGVSNAEDSEPNDAVFLLGLETRYSSEANSLAELLNKLHWACMLEGAHAGATKPLPGAQKATHR